MEYYEGKYFANYKQGEVNKKVSYPQGRIIRKKRYQIDENTHKAQTHTIIWKRFAYKGRYTLKENTPLKKNCTHQRNSTHKGDIQIRVYNHT